MQLTDQCRLDCLVLVEFSTNLFNFDQSNRSLTSLIIDLSFFSSLLFLVLFVSVWHFNDGENGAEVGDFADEFALTRVEIKSDKVYDIKVLHIIQL